MPARTRLADASSPYAQAFALGIRSLGQGRLSDHQAIGAAASQMVGQAYLLSSIEPFWICGWLSLGMIGLVWLSRRPTGPSGPIAAE